MPAFNPTSNETRRLIEAVVPEVEQNLNAAKKALENAKKSSARWADGARRNAAINTVASSAAAQITPCSLSNLTDFSCVFNAITEASEIFLRDPNHRLSASSIGELIALHQAFQGTAPDTQREVNKTMQCPEKIGLSAEVLNESLPDNTPSELATKMAALAIRDIMNRAGVNLSQTNNPSPRTGMSMGAGA